MGNYIPKEILNFIYLEGNLTKINDLNLKFNTCNYIVKNVVQNHKNSFELLKTNFREKYVIIQIIFSKLFPNYHLQNDKFGIQHKIVYDITLKNWLAEKDVIIIKEETEEKRRNHWKK